MRKDSYSSSLVFQAFSFSPLDGLTALGIGVDTKGAESLVAFIIAQNTSGGGFSGTALISFEDNNESAEPSAPWVTVEPDFIVGDPTDEILDETGIPKKLGYIGKNRYVRAMINASGGAAMRISGVYALGVPLNAPTGVQP